MILRLAVLTTLLALFAFGFSALVEHDNRNAASAWNPQPVASCFDQGAVCPRSPGGG